MRFFRRGRDRGSRGGAGADHPGHTEPGPDWVIAALRDVDIEAALRSTSVAGERQAWAVTVPGDRAIEAWTALRGRRDPGWWPIIIGGIEDEERLRESADFNDDDPSAIMSRAASLDADDVLERRRREAMDFGGETIDVVGNWPDGELERTSFTLPFDILTGNPRPTVIALVPAADPFEVMAVLGWGNWNECPRPEEHVAVHRRWADRYGAELVGVSGDVIEMSVARPPTGPDQAMALAHEHFAYCSDVVLQGTETISNLAATLVDNSVWYFWWD